MNIPFEVFFGFIGVSAFLFILGLVARIPASLVASGMFILLISAMADGLIMGQLVSKSTFANSTNITTYSYTPDIFQMNNYVRVGIALIGCMVILIGGLMTKSEGGVYE